METQAEENKTYTIPSEAQAAILTGRPILLAPLRARIKNGQRPTDEEWIGLIDMMADRMLDRQHEREAWREEKEYLLVEIGALVEKVEAKLIHMRARLDRFRTEVRL